MTLDIATVAALRLQKENATCLVLRLILEAVGVEAGFDAIFHTLAAIGQNLLK